MPKPKNVRPAHEPPDGYTCVDMCVKTAAHSPHGWELGDDQDPRWCPGLALAETGEFDVSGWWRRAASDDHDAFVPKFDEYGSEDLVKIGQNLADLIGRTVTDTEATELGIYFYMQGKMARWAEAVKEGRLVSDDTLHDLTVYSMMARLNRAGGMN